MSTSRWWHCGLYQEEKNREEGEQEEEKEEVNDGKIYKTKKKRPLRREAQLSSPYRCTENLNLYLYHQRQKSPLLQTPRFPLSKTYTKKRTKKTFLGVFPFASSLPRRSPAQLALSPTHYYYPQLKLIAISCIQLYRPTFVEG